MAVGATIALHPHRPHLSQEHHGALPDVTIETRGGQLFPGDAIGVAEHLETLPGDLADDPDAEPRPGERLAPHDGLGQAELEPDPTHLVLEEGAQWLDERELQVVGETPDVVVALDVGGARTPTRLHHVRVERALHQEVDRLAMDAGVGHHLPSCAFEHPDELTADDLALGLGLAHPGQGGEKLLLGVDHLERHAGRVHEVALHLLGLPGAQEPVVHEDARQPISDGALHEGCRDSRVDPAGQATQHSLVTHGGTDGRHLLFDDVGHRPGGLGAGDLVEEVLEHGLAVLGVEHLGMELHPGHAPAVVLEGGDGGACGAGGHLEPLGGSGHRVAVAHPDELLGGQPVEEGGVGRRNRERRASELGQPGLLHRSAKGEGHGLEPVADAEGGHVGLEERRVHVRSAVGIDRGRAAGEDDGHRSLGQHLDHGHRVGDDLAEHPGLAHAASDELGVLRPEVDDQHRGIEAGGHRSATTSAFWKSLRLS